MCCDGWNIDVEDEDVLDTCLFCGYPTVNGVARTGCNYSPETCEHCGAAPCDDSC
jgi:hypothetical protein